MLWRSSETLPLEKLQRQVEERGEKRFIKRDKNKLTELIYFKREIQKSSFKMSGGGGSSEKFCLKWNEFESNVSTAFRELREDKDFFDVTLACDGNQLEAHKVILSACSPFFRGVLKRNPHAHPLLYLKGIKYEDVLAVLNFMYHGEVNIAQDDLNSFLAVAEDLQVKGLTQSAGADHQPSPASLPKRQAPEQLVRPPKQQRTAPPPPRPSYDPPPQVRRKESTNFLILLPGLLAELSELKCLCSGHYANQGCGSARSGEQH